MLEKRIGRQNNEAADSNYFDVPAGIELSRV